MTGLRVFGDIVELDGYKLRDTRLLHGHAVEIFGHLHGDFIMRDDDKLRLPREVADDIEKTSTVGIIKRCIDLIEDAERRGFDLVEAEQQRDRSSYRAAWQ